MVLGYESVRGFVTMFRNVLGAPPRRYMAERYSKTGPIEHWDILNRPFNSFTPRSRTDLYVTLVSLLSVLENVDPMEP